jgi:RecA/RadA recombinase
MTTPTHAAALEYARHGWHVLPVWWPNPDGSCGCGNPTCKDIGKHPITTRGQHDATTDLRQVEAWWAQYPSANIGGALAPSDLIAFDIDKPESYAAWDEIEKQHPGINTTVQVSGSGCHHVIFKRPPFAIRGSYDKRITLRGNNFIVLAPSLHKSGGRYAWQDGRAPWQVPPAQMPPALAESLKRPEQAQSLGNHDYPPATPEVLQAAQEALLRHKPEVKGVSPQGHMRVAWGILVNDYALSPAEAAPLIRAYNAMCSPPYPEDKLFSSPCRPVQPWNNPRGLQRDRIYNKAQLEIAGYGPPVPRNRAQRIAEVAKQDEPPVRVIPTGLEDLDKLLRGGIRTRRVVGVVGPPSMGKSAFVGSIALNVQRSLPVLHFSTELPRKEVQVRYAAPSVGFPWSDGLEGRIPKDVIERAVAPLNIWIIGADDYDRNDPIGSLRAEAIAIREATGTAPLIIVDYVQMLARGSADSVRHKVGELTLALRTLAQELDCPVIAVFTTSRGWYGSSKEVERVRAANDPVAYLATAKEAGEIEYDCAVLIFLDLDMLRDGAIKPCRGAVARCRDGMVGFVGLRANLATGLWVGDPSAAAEVSSEERAAKRDADKLEGACTKLLETVDNMPGRSWNELKLASKLEWKTAEAARRHLVATDVLESVRVSTTDALCRRTVYDTLRRRESNAAPDVEPGESP